MPAKILRPRQVKLKFDIKEGFRRGFNKILAISPCGSGKTVVLVDIINDSLKKGKKNLFLAHRKELIENCSDDLSESNIDHGIIATDHDQFDLSKNAQVSSWQTLKNRSADIFIPDLIIYDEAHRSVAEQPMQLLSRYPNAKLIGFTATPYRSDGQGLGVLYDYLVESCQVSDLINEELLLRPDYYICGDIKNLPTSKLILPNYSEMSIDDFESSAEYAESRRIEDEIVIKADIVRNFKDICGHCQAVVFCPTVERAEEVAKKFELGGFKTGVVDALTPKKKRESLLRDFREKKFQIILNASLLSEGWNYPELECVIILRNLNSRIFYKQSIGRCMRIHPNKKKCYVLDFFNCIEKFGYIDDNETYSLDSKVKTSRIPKTEEELQNQFAVCVNCCEIFKSGFNAKCPACGTVNEKAERLILEQINNLKRIDRESHPITKNDKQAEFEKLCEKAMKRNHAPGWVNHQYRNKFGVWPKALIRTQEYRDYCERYLNSRQSEKENVMDLFGRMEYSSGDKLRTVKG